jgi:hypothetical protein
MIDHSDEMLDVRHSAPEPVTVRSRRGPLPLVALSWVFCS